MAFGAGAFGYFQHGALVCVTIRGRMQRPEWSLKKKATVALFAVDSQIADVAAHLVAFVKLLLSNLWVYVHIHVEMS